MTILSILFSKGQEVEAIINLVCKEEAEELCILKAQYRLFRMESLIAQESRFPKSIKDNTMEAGVVDLFKYTPYSYLDKDKFDVMEVEHHRHCK